MVEIPKENGKKYRVAERIKDGISKFIEPRLKIRVNREKTESAYVGRLEYYNLADMDNKVKETDQWLRIRMYIWKAYEWGIQARVIAHGRQ